MAKAKKMPTRREVLATTATAGVLALELSEIFSATAQKTDAASYGRLCSKAQRPTDIQ